MGPKGTGCFRWSGRDLSGLEGRQNLPVRIDLRSGCVEQTEFFLDFSSIILTYLPEMVLWSQWRDETRDTRHEDAMNTTQTKAPKMTKADLIHHYVNHDNRDMRFIANCIITGCGNVARKLKALYRLETEGKEIRTGNLWGQIRINGQQYEFSTLDTM
jgi:hypothetical protein